MAQTKVKGNFTPGNVDATKRVTSGVVTLTAGATVALNAALGNTFRLAVTSGSVQNTISVPSNATNGQRIIIQFAPSGTASGAALTLGLTQDTTGAFRFGTDITELNATTLNTTDYIGCIYNGSAQRWDVIAYVAGY